MFPWERGLSTANTEPFRDVHRKGNVKEVAGKATGDKKLQTEGKADKASGKIRNAVGGVKDAVRGR